MDISIFRQNAKKRVRNCETVHILLKRYPPTYLYATFHAFHLFEDFQVKNPNFSEMIYLCSSYISISISTRDAVAMRYFPSRRHRNDRLNMIHLIWKKKRIFEKVGDGDLDRRIHANVRNKTGESSVWESCSSKKASILSLIQEFTAVERRTSCNFEVCLT